MAYKKTSTYVAKPVDKNGNTNYTEDENQIWHELITRQMPILKNRACDEYMHGIDLIDFPKNRIPQCPEVSEVLQATTGWALEPVPALIPFDKFFHLLANRKFPAATFIRRREELDYLQEPDIFHEVFGHCPLLTNQAYADFTHTYGNLGLHATHEDRIMLAKLYWFTIEFGLIKTSLGLRAYGGGILSSMSETPYCLESNIPQRQSFNVLDVLRTPYRIDIMQPIYFVIDSFDVLFQLIDMDLIGLIHQARKLGMYPPVYEKKLSS
ncbi:MAG: phenylalanine 4-monooxygenase [Gammaproteobacteria bacterium RIFCSPHIGHO2_12_FULL_41_20]|nr:MAG: phenylalanine 4-monooxygenase [Gammaproteobacteria bacterium RIFCSPHIGHO2_12_FULL_41_20]